ncbi:MAG: hypothetical protein WC584_00670 [Candidatus Pacearchaeota archaeon]
MKKIKYSIAKSGLCLCTDGIKDFANIENTEIEDFCPYKTGSFESRKFSISLKFRRILR